MLQKNKNFKSQRLAHKNTILKLKKLELKKKFQFNPFLTWKNRNRRFKSFGPWYPWYFNNFYIKKSGRNIGIFHLLRLKHANDFINNSRLKRYFLIKKEKDPKTVYNDLRVYKDSQYSRKESDAFFNFMKKKNVSNIYKSNTL